MRALQGAQRKVGRLEVTQMHFRASAVKWKKELRVYQSRRNLAAMEEHDAQWETNLVASQAYIQLKAHMQFVTLCEEAAHLANVPAEKRAEVLSTIAAQVDPLPAGFQCTIIKTQVQSLKWARAGDVETWISLVKPFADAHEGQKLPMNLPRGTSL